MAFRQNPDDNQNSDNRRPQPTSAPAVPKGLLSARPAMTKVVPRSPDQVAQASQAMSPRPPQPGPRPLTPEEVAERQERLEYIKNLRQNDRRSSGKPRTKKGGKKWLVALLALLVLAGLGGGAYWYLSKPAETTKTDTNAQQAQQPSTTAPTTTNQEAADLKEYQSTNFAVAFKYPSTWTISDTAAKLTITSPQQSLTSASGSKVNGAVVVTIRPKQAALEEFKSGNAAAVLDSKRVSYTQPAAGQRDSTYLSYLQYAKTTTKGALDGIYVTGNAGYQKGQFVPQADVVKVDPLITVTFVQCSDEKCSPAVSPATNVQASSWDASQLNQTVEAILKSLAIS